jgi:hypothetical protein
MTTTASPSSAPEVEASGIDEDCDGLEACWVDADLDGWRTEETELSADLSCPRWTASPSRPPPRATATTRTPAVNPGAVEDPTNGIDDDCTDGVTCPRDDDGDGAASGTRAERRRRLRRPRRGPARQPGRLRR